MSIKIISHYDDGEVSVAIGTDKYTYWIDSAKIKHFLFLAGKSGFKALNYLKKNSFHFRKDSPAEKISTSEKI